MQTNPKATPTLAIVLPLIAAFLSQKGMQFIDTMMMGWLGPSALAAGAIGTAIFITILVTAMGTLSAVGVFIARAKGANNKNEIASYLLNGFSLALLLSMPCMGVAWFSPKIFIGTENKEVMHNATLLLHGLSMGLPGYLLFLVLREFISAFALTKIVMLVTMLSIPLTFTMNYIFIYGKYHFPPLGVAGIGYAGAIVMWCMFFCLLFYSLRNNQLREYFDFKRSDFNLEKIKDMLFIGIPSGTFFLLECGMFLSAILMMGHFGVDALAAFQITMQCVNIAYAIPFAISMATALQVSHAVGANEFHHLKTVALQNFSIGIMFSIIVAIFFIFFPEFFVKIFLKDDNAHMSSIQMAATFLIIAAFLQCFDAIQTIVNGMLRGLKDTFIPMLLSVGCYWLIGIVTAYFFSLHTSLGAKGIWYGITLGIFSLAIVLIIRLYFRVKELRYSR